ncbi:MAG: S49 family peptidase [candidate division KSB1 bacterium]|nr:S49 family peptidase [candidate division KSB1 bacterium]
MKTKAIFCFLLCGAAGLAAQPSFYYSRYEYLQAPASAFGTGLLGYANPATVALVPFPEFEAHAVLPQNNEKLQNWAVFSAVPGFGAGFSRKQVGEGTAQNNYHLALAGGNEKAAFGFGYQWSQTTGIREPAKEWRAGIILRPTRQLSFGAVVFFPQDGASSWSVIELGVRPLGTSRLTLFADGVLDRNGKPGEKVWSLGAAIQPITGLYAVGRYFGDESYSVGLTFDLGHSSIAAQTRRPDEGGSPQNLLMMRLGSLRPSWANRLIKQKAYTAFEIKGTVDYRKGMLFGGAQESFYPLLRDLRAAADDPRLAVIAVNLKGLLVRPEHAWELREELVRARKNGKKVIVFIEEAGMTGYHLASVADELVMDPLGMLFLPGLVMSRTYLKGTLEKLGLGFDEWRYFRWKSALETYSREDLSEADREQRQAYLDDWYELLRSDVCASRGFTESRFDSIVNQFALLSAEKARKLKLVDRLGRWDDLKTILKEGGKGRLIKLPRKDLYDLALYDDRWGGPQKIALIYGLGACDLESGIRGRKLAKLFERLAKDREIKAVVFRVDSPGGSALAADIVAEAMKKCAEKKPVIVSQGQVAGSGGYWISMYAKRIVAGPNTVTGSIGVIGGWVYDKGFSAKWGMSEDRVQRGDHADIESGVTLPVISLTVPRRNLTDEEKAAVEKWIREMYELFIGKVAQGRAMSREAVDAVGQGRFFSGMDGKEAGLVDEIGGLLKAVESAAEETKITDDKPWRIVEYYPKDNLEELLSSFFAVKTASDPTIDYLRILLDQPLKPVLMMSPDNFPSLER